MPSDLVRGRVTAVDGSHAKVSLEAEAANVLTVGKLLEIRSDKSAVVAVVTAVNRQELESEGHTTAEVDLLGEIVRGASGGPDKFQRGIREYPVIGAPMDILSSEDLKLIYDVSGPKTIDIGHLSQDPSIGGYIDVDEMLHKHFAVWAQQALENRAVSL